MAEERAKIPLPNFQLSVKLKYVKLGYHYMITHAMYLMLVPLLCIASVQLSTLKFEDLYNLWDSLKFNLVTVVLCSTVMVFLGTLHFMSRPKKVFLVDFSCFKPDPKFQCQKEYFVRKSKEYGIFTEENLEFQRKILERSGLGQKTYFPPALMREPPAPCMAEARQEAELVMFGAIDELLAKSNFVVDLIVSLVSLSLSPSLWISGQGGRSRAKMGIIMEDMIKQFQQLMDQVDEPLKVTFKNMHQGYPTEHLVRFLKARVGNVSNAHKMLVDCLNWRIHNEIDNILTKPIIPTDLYRSIRDSHLVGMSGYSKQGLPVIAIGVGLSTYDKASIHYYVQSHIQINEYRDRVILPSATKKFGRYIGTCIKILDMTGLKLSAMSQLKLLTVISTIDDLNYPEKADKYFIVNAPYVFSACWKVVKPLLQERTKKKIQVLSGCGRDELLKIMDYSSLPHFCRKEGSGSSRYSSNGTTDNCFSLDHPFHQELYYYIKQQARQRETPIKQGSFHVGFPEPDPEDAKIAETIEAAFQKLGVKNGISNSLHEIKINGN